ncbi:uncharacterized protein LOC111291913 [Durio zibethinus]|uniref:Uncharacterized protein LOC111291913 n=1 Tax=Durio zibethinus TaxID=66656 RepID=A0A6P5YI46_DURZI|nr:uncharacterized protein LOC111291913 [Durio zibethinus]
MPLRCHNLFGNWCISQISTCQSTNLGGGGGGGRGCDADHQEGRSLRLATSIRGRRRQDLKNLKRKVYTAAVNSFTPMVTKSAFEFWCFHLSDISYSYPLSVQSFAVQSPASPTNTQVAKTSFCTNRLKKKRTKTNDK